MITSLLFTFWFFLPAGVANMLPVLIKKLPIFKTWETPLDMHHTWRGRRVTGDHKTFRGLIGGTVCGVIFTLGQFGFMSAHPGLAALFPKIYLNAPPVVLGLGLSLGALLGDALKSVIKRQFDVAAGKSLLFFDQLDYVVGGLLGSMVCFFLPIQYYLLTLLMFFGLHVVVSYLGYRLGLKEAPI